MNVIQTFIISHQPRKERQVISEIFLSTDGRCGYVFFNNQKLTFLHHDLVIVFWFVSLGLDPCPAVDELVVKAIVPLFIWICFFSFRVAKSILCFCEIPNYRWATVVKQKCQSIIDCSGCDNQSKLTYVSLLCHEIYYLFCLALNTKPNTTASFPILMWHLRSESRSFWHLRFKLLLSLSNRKKRRMCDNILVWPDAKTDTVTPVNTNWNTSFGS